LIGEEVRGKVELHLIENLHPEALYVTLVTQEVNAWINPKYGEPYTMRVRANPLLERPPPTRTTICVIRFNEELVTAGTYSYNFVF
jgi:hypothetical protein